MRAPGVLDELCELKSPGFPVRNPLEETCQPPRSTSIHEFQYVESCNCKDGSVLTYDQMQVHNLLDEENALQLWTCKPGGKKPSNFNWSFCDRFFLILQSLLQLQGLRPEPGGPPDPLLQRPYQHPRVRAEDDPQKGHRGPQENAGLTI